MIEYQTGSIFDSPAEAIVNPVNCVGAMGKGLALQFRKRYRKNYGSYKLACLEGRIQLGRVSLFRDLDKWIINFPTKYHWREHSELRNLETGLVDLKLKIRIAGITSVAIPALGCGLGELDYKDVQPLLETSLKDEDQLFYLYSPKE